MSKLLKQQNVLFYEIFDKFRNMNIDLQLLLYGSNTLSENENADLFKLKHTYIKQNTERF